MCGICGGIGGGADVRRMASRMAHRGPDGEGFFEDRLGLAGGRGERKADACLGAYRAVSRRDAHRSHEVRRRVGMRISPAAPKATP